MNILYIHTHDSGRYLNHYGFADAPTPNLSNWAKREAMSFRNAYTVSPTCSPSRAALLTGQYPHSNGMIGLAHRGFRMHNYDNHLVRFLKRHNYQTILCGVQHEAGHCFDSTHAGKIIGYDEDISSCSPSLETYATWDEENGHKVVDFLSKDHAKPFFLSYGLFSTHRPYPTQEYIDSDACKAPPYIYDSKENRVDHAQFLSSLSLVDRCFNTVISALQESSYAENTIVLVTTDHGVALPHAKCNLTEAGLGIALMMKVPHKRITQPFCDAMIANVDVFPTLCDLLHLPIPEYVQGESFAHLFDHPQEAHRTYLFSEVTFHTSYEPMRSVRTARYSYVSSKIQGEPIYHLSNIDNSPAKTLLLESGLREQKKSTEELYDRYLDPLECANLIDDEAYAPIRTELSNTLKTWQKESEDPLLHAHYGIPVGAKVNRAESIEADSPHKEDYL